MVEQVRQPPPSLSESLAARSKSLEFTGFEISSEYYSLQEKRFQEYTAQQDMFHLCLSERGETV